MTPIKKVSEYVEAIYTTHTYKGDCIYRGQPCLEPLLPKIARRTMPAYSEKAEKILFQDFRTRSVGVVGPDNRTDLEWLAIAQHHGLPTRLLDWTFNALAALYFAIKESPGSDFAPTVWRFYPQPRDFIDPETTEKPWLLGNAMVYRPKHVASRIIAQAGCFTLHAGLKHSNAFIHFEDVPKYRDRLRKFDIEKSAQSELLAELDRLGVNEATLFPDLAGICRHLSWQYQR